MVSMIGQRDTSSRVMVESGEEVTKGPVVGRANDVLVWMLYFSCMCERLIEYGHKIKIPSQHVIHLPFFYLPVLIHPNTASNDADLPPSHLYRSPQPSSLDGRSPSCLTSYLSARWQWFQRSRSPALAVQLVKKTCLSLHRPCASRLPFDIIFSAFRAGQHRAAGV